MSAFMNGSSGSSSGIGNAIANAAANVTGGGTNDTSGLTSALASGSGSVTGTGANTDPGNSYAFQLPSDVSNVVAGGTGTDPTAGLTGTQSGMTMPNFSNAMSGSGDYSFNMPTGGGANLGALAAGGMKAGQQLANQQGPRSGGSGRVSTRAENFNAPVIALPMASGSNAGNSLLQMMQRYQPGNVVGTNTGSGYGNR